MAKCHLHADGKSITLITCNLKYGCGVVGCETAVPDVGSFNDAGGFDVDPQHVNQVRWKAAGSKEDQRLLEEILSNEHEYAFSHGMATALKQRTGIYISEEGWCAICNHEV